MDDDLGALTEETRRVLAEDPRLGQLDVSITLRGKRALLTGHVVTRDRQELLAAVVAEHLPGYEIDNATTTLENLPEPPEAAGFRVERPPEGWLFKAWDDDVLVDLIWAPTGLTVTDDVLRAARMVNVDGMEMPSLAPTDVLTSKLLALNESHLDFESLLAIVRGVREQVDWAELRRRTEEQPLARSFLYMAGELGLISEAARENGAA